MPRRAGFSRLLARAKEGEEIVITKGSKPQARIVPPAEAGQREAAPLKHLNLPDDLFDRAEPEQAMIDAGDCSDTLGIWRGPPKALRLLLDSHAVYWWAGGSPRLSETARGLIVDRENTLLVSAVSIYELEWMAIRARVALPSQELRAALRRNSLEDLPITHDHGDYAARLDWDHRDPWDRLLAAQARLENCALVSVDAVFDAIVVDRRW